MHRSERHRPVEPDPFLWASASSRADFHRPALDRDTRALLHRGLHATHGAPLGSGGAHEPPRVRPRRPAARTWRSARAARFSIGEERLHGRGRVDHRESDDERRDWRAGGLGMLAGALLGALAVRSAGSYAFRPEWLVATVPLVTLWASVGGLVAISIARAARGHEPLPELVSRSALGERRSLARPVALGLVIGAVVVAALRAAIALAAWLPAVPPG